MQRMRRRAFEAKPRVPLLGLLVDRMDEQGADPDQLAGLKDSCHAIKQQRAPEVLALMASIDRQATEQDDRHRLISRQSPRWPGRTPARPPPREGQTPDRPQCRPARTPGKPR